jgi:hypothetical protein
MNYDRPPWTWREALVLAFTVAYLLPAAFVCLRGGNREFILYLGVMLLLIPSVGALHHTVRFHPATLWGLSLWGLAHLAGGLVAIPSSWPYEDAPVLYDWWLIPERLKYDQVIHAFGFGLTTWVCWQGLARAFENRGAPIQPTLGLMTFCVAAGMGFGALNEVVEFVATLTIPNTNVGGYENTGWDLVSNAVGCTIAAVAIAFGSQGVMASASRRAASSPGPAPSRRL